MTNESPWLELLAPWCEPLRGLVALETTSHTHSSRFLLHAFDWLRVSLRPPPSSASAVIDACGDEHSDRQLRRYRQAFQLLGLLAHVDIHAFREVLKTPWGLSSELVDSVSYAGVEEEDNDDEGACARFAFQFDGDSIAENVRWPEMLCTQLFMPESATAHHEYSSDEGDLGGEDECYRRIRTKILARTAGGERRGERPENTEVVAVPISLEFNPLGIGYSDLVEFLLSVVNVVRTLRDRDMQRQTTTESESGTFSQNGGVCAIAFKLEAVKLHLYSFEITTEVAEILTTLAKLGVTVSNLAIRLRESDISEGWCSRAAQGALFEALTGVPQDVPPPSSSSAVDCITIQSPSVGVDQFAALSSALAVSKHVSTLNLFSVFDDASRTNRITKWKWLAYALFSCDSVISVGKLGVNGQKMLLEDVEAMIAVIQSSNPVQELFSSDSAHSTSMPASTSLGRCESIAHLSQGTTVRLAPLDEGDDWGLDDTLFLDRDVQVQMLSDDGDEDGTSSEWLGVLVPGFGRCWVHRGAVSKIVPRVVEDVETVVTTEHQVTSFAISFDVDVNGGFTALRRLLSVIGGPLQSLEIFQAYGFAVACLADVLRFCPKLRNLYIEGIELSTRDIDAFIELYDSQGCVLSSLTFEDYQVSSESITRLAHALADPSRRIARTIQELCIGESTEEITLDEANVQAFLAMLQVNKTLLYLELHLPSPLYGWHIDAFMEQNNRYLPVEKRDLPLRSRLALLSISAVSRFNQLRDIDERVLSHVFDFAAVASARRVVIREL